MSTVVKIFLASPGDLADERLIVRERAEHFNKLWSDQFKTFFRVIGWEDLPPTAQRPQGRINKDAEECELFIGMMATRWGSDSGEFSSGFEEEFFTARQRWKSSGSPEIALFFRTLESSQIADPGPQLSKVLQFKKSVIEGKEFLFKEFSNKTDLANFVDGVLSQYAIDRQHGAANQPSTSILEVEKTTQSEEVDATEIDHILAAAGAAGGVATEKFDTWAKLRLHLYSTSIYSNTNGEAIIGRHEANLIYRKRDEWRLTDGELWTLSRAMLADAGYISGWFWLAKGGVSVTRHRLWFFCCVGDEEKGRAAEILSSDSQLPSNDLLKLALQQPACIPSISKLLGRVGTLEHIEVLKEVRDEADEPSLKHFENAEFLIKQRHNMDFPIGQLIKYAGRNISGAQEELTKKLTQLPPMELELWVKTGEEEARYTILKMLGKVDLISEALANDLIKDSSKRIRHLAVQELIKKGRAFTRSQLSELFPEESSGGGLLGFSKWVDIGALVADALKNRSTQELEGMIDFFDLDASSAFALLADREWGAFRDEVERQLDSEFQLLLDESEARFKEQRFFSVLALWQKDGSHLVEYVRSDFLSLTLQIVKKHGHPKAEAWGLKYSQTTFSESVRSAALQLLLDVGASIDRAVLIEGLSAGNSALAEKMVKAIVNAGAFDAVTFEAIANQDSRGFRDSLIDVLSSDWGANFEEIVGAFLSSQSDRVRMVAARAIAKNFSREALEAKLNEYINLPTYYYDVASLFDTALYRPREFDDTLLPE